MTAIEPSESLECVGGPKDGEHLSAPVAGYEVVLGWSGGMYLRERYEDVFNVECVINPALRSRADVWVWVPM